MLAWRELFGAKGASNASALRMCPHCRGLVERDASVCPLCGSPMKSPRPRGGGASGRVLGVIPIPSTATSILVASNIALYALEWYLTQSSASAELQAAPSWGGVDGKIMVRLGAKFGPLIFRGEWWRLVTANFLHAGLMHIGFNLWCLFDLGPEVESLFSTSKFVVMYLVTGIFGYVLSLFWSPFGVSVGASASILGLIGVLIGASFHHGRLGKDYRSQLWRWVLYIFIFGLLPFFAIDNAAHIGGLASGLALGYVIPEGEPEARASENLWSTLTLLSVALIAGSFALMALQLGRPL